MYGQETRILQLPYKKRIHTQGTATPDLSSQKLFPNFYRTTFKKYRPARLDLHGSGIIGKPFKSTSTAIGV
jgi:hypothetical protein